MSLKPYCLSKEELSHFIEIELHNSDNDEKNIAPILESWHSWDKELICLATVFSQYLEKELKANGNGINILDNIFDLPENKSGLWVTIEGFGEEFVKYFLNNLRNPKMTIEDDLNYLREQLGEYNY